MSLVSICVIGYRSPEIVQSIGMAGAAQGPALIAATPPPRMSAEEQRGGVDKLLNFFARGKYE